MAPKVMIQNVKSCASGAGGGTQRPCTCVCVCVCQTGKFGQTCAPKAWSDFRLSRGCGPFALTSETDVPARPYLVPKPKLEHNKCSQTGGGRCCIPCGRDAFVNSCSIILQAAIGGTEQAATRQGGHRKAPDISQGQCLSGMLEKPFGPQIERAKPSRSI